MCSYNRLTSGLWSKQRSVEMNSVRRYLLYLLLLMVKTCNASVSTHVVNTTLGSVVGSVEEVILHDDVGNTTTAEFVRYLGIPYAEPPVGNMRFRKPVPKKPWTSMHNGTVAGPRCYHGDSRRMAGPDSSNPAPISEDCLTLDIYAPVGSINSSNTFAVIVFMPSDSGSSHNYPGSVLSAFGDIIYIVVNFRTGILGYFSLGNDVIPGNFGLWDQQLALSWINTNIASFSGDPQRVTLVSFGIGASRAIFQALYPGNRDLFQRVIAHSGSPIPVYNTTAFLQRPYGDAITEALRCTRPTSEEVASCMRALSLSEVQLGLSAMQHTVPLTPVVENDFIVERPEIALSSNDSKFETVKNMFSSIQLLAGITNMEGGTHVALMWSELLHQEINNFQVNRSSFDEIVVPVAMELIFGKNLTESIIKTVAFQYTDGKDPLNETKIRNSVVQLSTDLDTSTPVVKLGRFHSSLNGAGTFLYQFSARLGIDTPLTPSWLSGANYGDDIYFLLGFSNLKLWQHTMNYAPTDLEIQTSNMLMTMWTNFAKTGDPNRPNSKVTNASKWLPYDLEQSAYMDIGLGVVSSGMYFREPFMQFWTRIIPGLLKDIRAASAAVPDTVTGSTCAENCTSFSSRFDVNGLTADNIIIALIIASFCMLMAFLAVCSIAISKGTFYKYNVKSEL